MVIKFLSKNMKKKVIYQYTCESEIKPHYQLSQESLCETHYYSNKSFNSELKV